PGHATRAIGFFLVPTLSARAGAEETPPQAWELDAFAGYGRLLWPWMDTASGTSGSGGPAFALTVAYRGPHFTHPFLDISYVPILSTPPHAPLPAPAPP